MKYQIQYQYMPKDSTRPLDFSAFTIEDQSNVLLPNVGDYVWIDDEVHGGGEVFKGKVTSRFFSYANHATVGAYCAINIVFTDVDDKDWGKVIKS